MRIAESFFLSRGFHRKLFCQNKLPRIHCPRNYARYAHILGLMPLDPNLRCAAKLADQCPHLQPPAYIVPVVHISSSVNSIPGCLLAGRSL